MTLLYFGCWGGTGHYLWSPDGRQVPHQGAPQPPGKGWRRGCQPLRDGRWTWLISLPPLAPPAPTCRVWKHLSERLDDLLPTENA